MSEQNREMIPDTLPNTTSGIEKSTEQAPQNDPMVVARSKAAAKIAENVRAVQLAGAKF